MNGETDEFCPNCGATKDEPRRWWHDINRAWFSCSDPFHMTPDLDAIGLSQDLAAAKFSEREWRWKAQDKIAEVEALEADLSALREQLAGLVEALAPFWPDDYLLEAEDEGPTAFCLLLHGSLVERQAQADRIRELDALLHPKGSTEEKEVRR